MLRCNALQQCIGQTLSFRTKHEPIAGTKSDLGIAARRARGKDKDALGIGTLRLLPLVNACVHAQGRKLMVVKPGSAHFGVVDWKAEWLN